MTWTAGGTAISTAFVGSTALAGLYVGDKKVWPMIYNVSGVSGTVTVEKNPIAVRVTPDGAHLYVANAGSNTVSVIDTRTLSVVATIPVGSYPHDVGITRDGRRVYVPCNAGGGGSNRGVWVIDTASNTVVKTITNNIVFPYEVCVAADGKHVYVTDAKATNNDVVVIDAATDTIVTRISGFYNPHGICESPDGSTLYVANGGSPSVRVVSTATNTITGAITLNSGQAESVISSPDGKYLYVGHAPPANTISVIDLATNTVAKEIPANGPARMSLSLDGSRVYIPCANEVLVIDPLTNTVRTRIPVVGSAIGSCVSPDGSQVYVTIWQSGSVITIS
jgi:YVTN family beta-propeller protein